MSRQDPNEYDGPIAFEGKPVNMIGSHQVVYESRDRKGSSRGQWLATFSFAEFNGRAECVGLRIERTWMPEEIDGEVVCVLNGKPGDFQQDELRSLALATEMQKAREGLFKALSFNQLTRDWLSHQAEERGEPPYEFGPEPPDPGQFRPSGLRLDRHSKYTLHVQQQARVVHREAWLAGKGTTAAVREWAKQTLDSEFTQSMAEKLVKRARDNGVIPRPGDEAAVYGLPEGTLTQRESPK